MGNRYNKVILIVFTLFFVCCKTKDSEKPKNLDSLKTINSIKTEEKNVPRTHRKGVLDVLNVDSLTIRGVKTNISIDILKLNWRRSDSIKSYIADCGAMEGKTIKVFYRKGIMFELFDEKANLKEIDFTQNNDEIKHPKIVLNKNTSIKDVEIFKNSYLNKKEYDKGVDEYIKIKFLTKVGWDDRIILVFKNGKLVKLYFSDLPC